MQRPEVWRANVSSASLRGRAAYDAATAVGPGDGFLGGLATDIGRYDEANAFFAKSSAFCDRVGGKFNTVRTDLSWRRMLTELEARRRLKGLARSSPRAYCRSDPRVRPVGAPHGRRSPES